MAITKFNTAHNKHLNSASQKGNKKHNQNQPKIVEAIDKHINILKNIRTINQHFTAQGTGNFRIKVTEILTKLDNAISKISTHTKPGISKELINQFIVEILKTDGTINSENEDSFDLESYLGNVIPSENKKRTLEILDDELKKLCSDILTKVTLSQHFKKKNHPSGIDEVPCEKSQSQSSTIKRWIYNLSRKKASSKSKSQSSTTHDSTSLSSSPSLSRKSSTDYQTHTNPLLQITSQFHEPFYTWNNTDQKNNTSHHKTHENDQLYPKTGFSEQNTKATAKNTTKLSKPKPIQIKQRPNWEIHDKFLNHTLKESKYDQLLRLEFQNQPDETDEKSNEKYLRTIFNQGNKSQLYPETGCTEQNNKTSLINTAKSSKISQSKQNLKSTTNEFKSNHRSGFTSVIQPNETGKKYTNMKAKTDSKKQPSNTNQKDQTGHLYPNSFFYQVNQTNTHKIPKISNTDKQIKLKIQTIKHALITDNTNELITTYESLSKIIDKHKTTTFNISASYQSDIETATKKYIAYQFKKAQKHIQSNSPLYTVFNRVLDHPEINNYIKGFKTTSEINELIKTILSCSILPYQLLVNPSLNNLINDIVMTKVYDDEFIRVLLNTPCKTTNKSLLDNHINNSRAVVRSVHSQLQQLDQLSCFANTSVETVKLAIIKSFLPELSSSIFDNKETSDKLINDIKGKIDTLCNSLNKSFNDQQSNYKEIKSDMIKVLSQIDNFKPFKEHIEKITPVYTNDKASLIDKLESVVRFNHFKLPNSNQIIQMLENQQETEIATTINNLQKSYLMRILDDVIKIISLHKSSTKQPANSLFRKQKKGQNPCKHLISKLLQLKKELSPELESEINKELKKNYKHYSKP